MSVVKVEKQDKIAIVTIDNPPMNTMSEEVIQALGETFAKLNADSEVLAIIITGAGERAFMAGGEIKDFPEKMGNSNLVPEFLKTHKILNSIDFSPKPTIAVLNGYALGGGCELALTCDLRISEEQALLGVPESTLGLLPGGGGTQRLPRLIGEARAKELMFTGEHITAEEALRIGLVNRVVPKGEGLDAGLKLAKKICRNSPTAVRNIKKAVDEGLELPFNKAIEREAELFQELFLTEDVKEGVQAFLEKRRPEFLGK
ncbi:MULTISPECIES: enoyl-CoA hydratase/isomerase family protein [unclassified Sporosarcina]|uniref:enoyl-CoA hydratase/isomerase family protein n=1 Tax=unclassified Sporosarcina TaxID=2647733 RepID=UPI000C164D8C|nr:MULTISPECIES: enoyl-CoA hydratase [unclassified Sporosarcina]PID04061.1 enoyl-CoA hydratase [Sporosarcina sp. P2]PID25053.1 enoyl-CoA hydratase [Sporosarcina sp. P7]